MLRGACVLVVRRCPPSITHIFQSDSLADLSLSLFIFIFLSTDLWEEGDEDEEGEGEHP
jgi:hypothetical protein